MLGRPSAWRTWMCTIAAPALAEEMQAWAICSGVQGSPGCWASVGWWPVPAAVRMGLPAMALRSLWRRFSLERDFPPAGCLKQWEIDARLRRPFNERHLPSPLAGEGGRCEAAAG